MITLVWLLMLFTCGFVCYVIRSWDWIDAPGGYEHKRMQEDLLVIWARSLTDPAKVWKL